MHTSSLSNQQRVKAPLLLPSNPKFIYFSLFLALILNFIPGSIYLPDFFGLCFAFWMVREPRYIGMWTALVAGIALDVHHGVLLGHHVLAYGILGFYSQLGARQILWVKPALQACFMLPLFAFVQLIFMAVVAVAQKHWPDWLLMVRPLWVLILWPVLDRILLAPQRRPIDPDNNRPL